MTLVTLSEFATVTGIDAGPSVLCFVTGFERNLVADPLPVILLDPCPLPGPMQAARGVTALASNSYGREQLEWAEVDVTRAPRLLGSVTGAVVSSLVLTRKLSLLDGFSLHLSPRCSRLRAAWFASSFVSASANVGKRRSSRSIYHGVRR